MGTDKNPVWHCSKYTKYLSNACRPDKSVTHPATESIA